MRAANSNGCREIAFTEMEPKFQYSSNWGFVREVQDARTASGALRRIPDVIGTCRNFLSINGKVYSSASITLFSKA